MTVHDHRRGLVVVHRMLDRCSSVFLAAALLAVSAAPLAAQGGRDLLAPEPLKPVRAVRSGLIDRVQDVSVASRGRLLSSTRNGAVAASEAATEVYRYDDNVFEHLLFLVNDSEELVFEFEFAQRFRLPREGTVRYAVACMERTQEDTESDARFRLNFYSGAGNTPRGLLAAFDVAARLSEPGAACFEVGGELEGLSLDAGQVWVAVSWLRGTPSENTKYLMLDEDGSGGARAFRGRQEEDGDWETWQPDPDPGVYGIRLAVDHPDPAPDPEPDPDPDPEPDPDPDPEPPSEEGYTDCEPQTTPLLFDGGYGVGLCYETPSGEIGEGKGGIWASGESGLLWFFSRGNAEVLVKVLNGCAHNGHRWVFVAPVTDVAFNLYVTDGENEPWSHRNRQGQVAVPARDTFAFPCRE
ncbi:MAG: hypothetical protein OXG81_00620 [Acidobacteria bacterium]|nr:hypothetical protein [Acidobacteriota bacterium]